LLPFPGAQEDSHKLLIAVERAGVGEEGIEVVGLFLLCFSVIKNYGLNLVLLWEESSFGFGGVLWC